MDKSRITEYEHELERAEIKEEIIRKVTLTILIITFIAALIIFVVSIIKEGMNNEVGLGDYLLLCCIFIEFIMYAIFMKVKCEKIPILEKIKREYETPEIKIIRREDN